jgi:hypothetical protein
MKWPAWMSTTPIIIFHQSRSWYLPYVLHQARAACPSSEVVLASELPVRSFPLLPLKNFETSKRATEFRRCYQHMSMNPERYELFCYLRWFYLLEYMQMCGLKRALHLDSDFLLYSSIEELARSHPIRAGEAALSIPYQSHESLVWLASGHISLFTVEALDRFCNFASASFTEERWLSQYRHKWKHHGAAGGICDMTTLYLFCREDPGAVVNLAEERCGAVVDLKFNSSANYRADEYQLRDGVKRVELQCSKPVIFRQDGRPVRALGLHFQGSNKLHIPRYYLGPSFAGKTLSDLRAAAHLRTAQLKKWASRVTYMRMNWTRDWKVRGNSMPNDQSHGDHE